MHLTHYRQNFPGDGSHLDYIALVEDARDEGMDVTFDCYPYIYSSTRYIIAIPDWAQDGGPDRLREVLTSADERQRLKQDMLSRGGGRNPSEGWLTNFRKPANKQYEGHSLREVARMRGQDDLDAIFDLLLDEDLGVCSVREGVNPQTLPAFVAHPLGMVGSDAIPPGGVSKPAHLRLLPSDSGGVRPSREALASARGHPKDDVLPRPATGTEDPRSPQRRNEGGHGHLQPGHGEGTGYKVQPQAVPSGHTIRHREREARHRRR